MTVPLHPHVRLRTISHAYAGVPVLSGVSLDIPKGAYAVLLGPSGSGKTTLLNVLGGFVPPDAGRVEIGGTDITALPPARRPTTTVFQDYALFPHLSVGANVAFGLRMQGRPTDERAAKAEAMLDLVGLSGLSGRRPQDLSGGQRQRVALARALAVDPAVLLLDEPLGALDLQLRRQMQDELKGLQRRLGTTFVHVTHDQEEAMALADLLVVMRTGRVDDVGPPARVYARPASLFTARFMGEITAFPASVSGPGHGGSWDLNTALGPLNLAGSSLPPAARTRGARVVVAFRPEDAQLLPLSAEVAAPLVPLGQFTVGEPVFQGGFIRLRGTLAGELAAPAIPATVRLPAHAGLSAGDVLRLSVASGRLLSFADA